MNKMNAIAEASSDSRQFAVGLSFPGEHRDFVAKVADHLAVAFGKGRVLYDKYFEAEFARLDLDQYLPRLYRTQSELIVLFLYPDYKDKRWCRLELRAIRQLIETVDAKRIMLFRRGYDVDFSDLGIYRGDGSVNLDGRPADEIADLIIQRYRINEGTTAPKPPTHARNIPVDISRIDKYAPVKLIGREAETARLNEAWEKAQRGETDRPRVLTFVGLGGEGKTSLVAKWLAGLADHNWPGCDAAFAWSIYSQGTQDRGAASSDLFLKEALTFFGDAETAGGALGSYEKGRRLAQLVGEKRALLILDGVEPLQYAPTAPVPGELKDQGLIALLKGFAANNRGLCVVTTRHSIPDLRAYMGRTVQEENLDRLSKEAGRELLEHLGVKGTPQERETLVEDVKGHALTLTLLGAWLHDAHDGDIRKRDLVKLEEADEDQGGHAFRVMDAYVQWFESEGKHGKIALALLRLMGLFNRPAEAGCLNAVWKAPLIPDLTEPLVSIREEHRNRALNRLKDAKLITVNRDGAGTLLSLDAHPLLREYFAKQLREHRPAVWRAAHSRIYGYLCATTSDKKPEPTLEDLQPLYQAVYHGCQAGMQQEACENVYRDRIVRRRDFYSVHKLGAWGSDLGALSCFFDQPWSNVSSGLTDVVQSWLLSTCAYSLRSLGRLNEAIKPLQAGLRMNIQQRAWSNAAAAARNLSDLQLSLGEVASAVVSARHALDYAGIYAGLSGDAFAKMRNCAAYADTLHQAGRRDEAAAWFREAENIQAVGQPELPLLYSIASFLYCDLLLVDRI